MDNSAEFAQWWARFTTIGCPAETEKVVNHPTAGRLNLLETALILADHPCLRVVLFLAQDEATKETLQALYDARMAERSGPEGNGRLAAQAV